MVAAVEPMPISSSTRFVAVLSLKAIMRWMASRSENLAPAEKWSVRMPEPGTLSEDSSVTGLVEVDPPSRRPGGRPRP
jgi:hypothetical protein